MVMVARVWLSSRTATPSFASTAWCSPSDQRRPGINRPVNSSTMNTWPSCTTYSTSFSYNAWAWSSLWMMCRISLF